MYKESILSEKSLNFAAKTVKFCVYVNKKTKESIITKQLMQSISIKSSFTGNIICIVISSLKEKIMPNKINTSATWIYALISLVYTVSMLFQSEYIKSLYGLLAVISYFLVNYLGPALLKNNICLFMTNLYIFAAGFLGLILRYYDSFDSYDLIMHLYGGVLFSLYGFNIFDNLKKRGVEIHRSYLIHILIFCFATTVLLLWECGEYFLDVTLGTDHMNSKATGVGDTMTDLLIGMGGSILTIAWKRLKNFKKF